MTNKQNSSVARSKLAAEQEHLTRLRHSLEVGVFAGSRANVETKIEKCREEICRLTAELETSTRQVHKLYHVELFEGKKKHHYFGSQAAIYDTFTPEQIGVSLDYLHNTIDLTLAPYENKKCIIRLGEVKRKHTLRGKKT